MATKKDMRRADLGALSSTLPMAAMFTRSRMIGWTSVVFSLQNWMAESPEQKKNSSTPGYFYGGYCSRNHLPPQMDDFQQANAISQDLRSLIPTSSSGKTGQGGSHVLSHPSSIVQIQCFNNENVNNIWVQELLSPRCTFKSRDPHDRIMCSIRKDIYDTQVAHGFSSCAGFLESVCAIDHPTRSSASYSDSFDLFISERSLSFLLLIKLSRSLRIHVQIEMTFYMT
ncbi:hypothetical protein CISG_02671 [Coccidioides immitis RMSCC 3703]|uniref:Uncharacterized protein n=1 Tax=Coccidioides immitis RMSCC 3703 TaxID=454286 RepID=A0A0J8RCN4_COCIT|nr:hypothetical protein CISG_02671 [Coccidioides immitis RMSCC 3703]